MAAAVSGVWDRHQAADRVVPRREELQADLPRVWASRVTGSPTRRRVLAATPSTLIAKATPVRLVALERVATALVDARALSLAYVPLRERIDSIIEEVDECLRGLR